MAKYKCTVCGFIYDDDQQGYPFEIQDDTYMCTVCSAPKSEFEKIED